MLVLTSFWPRDIDKESRCSFFIFHWVYFSVVVVRLFGAAVFVHEFGHFWVARRLGLKVDGFSIGFGPKLFGWTRNGIDYAWRLIPAGGFVALPQMAGSETTLQIYV